MPLRHIAWLKFKKGVSPDNIGKHMIARRGLAESVPTVEKLECGANCNDRSGGFTHGIIVSLVDKDALKAYLNHPSHIPVAEALVTDVAELKVIDIEF